MSAVVSSGCEEQEPGFDLTNDCEFYTCDPREIGLGERTATDARGASHLFYTLHKLSAQAQDLAYELDTELLLLETTLSGAAATDLASAIVELYPVEGAPTVLYPEPDCWVNTSLAAMTAVACDPREQLETPTVCDGACDEVVSGKTSSPEASTVDCSGNCLGEVDRPAAMPPCRAAAAAFAQMNVSCDLPGVALSFEVLSEAPDHARDELEAFAVVFERRLADLLRTRAEARWLLRTAQSFLEASHEAGSYWQTLRDDKRAYLSFVEYVELPCVIDALPIARSSLVLPMLELDASLKSVDAAVSTLGG
jgi:hypothetical protein